MFPLMVGQTFVTRVICQECDNRRDLAFSLLPADSGAVCRLELQDHGEEGGVYVPDAGKDEADDGEAGHAPNEPHLHIEQP